MPCRTRSRTRQPYAVLVMEDMVSIIINASVPISLVHLSSVCKIYNAYASAALTAWRNQTRTLKIPKFSALSGDVCLVPFKIIDLHGRAYPWSLYLVQNDNDPIDVGLYLQPAWNTHWRKPSRSVSVLNFHFQIVDLELNTLCQTSTTQAVIGGLFQDWGFREFGSQPLIAECAARNSSFQIVLNQYVTRN